MSEGLVYLVADVGGTNIRFQLFSLPIDRSDAPDEATGECRVAERIYSARRFSHLRDALSAFLSDHLSPNKKVVSACLALAGPVGNGVCVVTNLDWLISGREIETLFHIPRVALINDFVAAGYGCLAVPSASLLCIHQSGRAGQSNEADSGQRDLHPVKAILGAGTGLGEAFAVYDEEMSQYKVFPTEGGHADFSARTEEEWQLMQSIKRRLKIDRMSVERLVSGTAIPNIYHAYKELHPDHVQHDIDRAIQQGDAAANISKYAQNKACELCVRTINMFVSLYASECGNLALKTLPFGGIYIAGGIATKIMWAMKSPQFVQSFVSKGRMKPLLESIPIYVVSAEAEVGLLGSQVVARRLYAAQIATQSPNLTNAKPRSSSHLPPQNTVQPHTSRVASTYQAKL